MAATPQIAINYKNSQTFSPFVQANYKGTSLMTAQLHWGVFLQRYETSTRLDVPNAAIYYSDPAGLALRSKEPVTFSEIGLWSYAKLVARYPITFAGIYIRHLANGLDVRDGIVYLSEKSENRDLFSFLLFSLMFGACLIIYAHWKPTTLGCCKLLLLFIPVIAIIPSAIETRFFLPAYLVMFGGLVTLFEWATFKLFVQQNALSVATAFFLSSSAFVAITTSTMANATYQFP